MRLVALLLLATISVLSEAKANGDIVRCGDANGNTLFTDTGCPTGMRVVGTTSLAQSCNTEDCQRRRERDLREARERVWAEKEELAAQTAARYEQEIEDRRLDEARYEAELRDGKAGQVASGAEAPYPVYPVIVFPKCGRIALPFPVSVIRLTR
jgi:hypothetical protein